MPDVARMQDHRHHPLARAHRPHVKEAMDALEEVSRTFLWKHDPMLRRGILATVFGRSYRACHDRRRQTYLQPGKGKAWEAKAAGSQAAGGSAGGTS